MLAMPKQTKQEFIDAWANGLKALADLLDAEECNCGMCDGWILVEKKKKQENKGEKK